MYMYELKLCAQLLSFLLALSPPPPDENQMSAREYWRLRERERERERERDYSLWAKERDEQRRETLTL
jgi:hypothetical protein